MKRACHKYQPRIRRVITCFKRDSTPSFKSFFFLFLVHHVKDYVWNHTQLADPYEDQLAPPQSPSVTPFTVFWSLWNLPSHKGWSCTRSWQSWERFSSSVTRSKEYPSLITHYNDCFFLGICPQPVEIQQNHYDPCRSSSYRPISLANSI